MIRRPPNPQRDAGKFRKYEEWILDTEGINLEQVLAFEGVDPRRTMSNSIIEVLEVLGIEVRGRGLAWVAERNGELECARRDMSLAVRGVHTGVWGARLTVRSAKSSAGCIPPPLACGLPGAFQAAFASLMHVPQPLTRP